MKSIEFKKRYSFIKHTNLDNEFDTTKVIVHSSAETLSELLSDILDFVKACGYSLKPGAELEIIEDSND